MRLGRLRQRDRWIQGLVLLPLFFFLPQSLQPAPPGIPVALQWKAMVSERNQAWHRLAGSLVAPIRLASHKTGLSPALLAAVVYVESRGRAGAVSAAGAIGPMQLMPATAWTVLHVNPWQVQQNILGGAQFLQSLLKLFHGNLTLALEAYNAGPTRVASGEPPPPSAVTYAKTVETFLRRAEVRTASSPQKRFLHQL